MINDSEWGRKPWRRLVFHHLAVSLEEEDLSRGFYVFLEDVRATGDHDIHKEHIGGQHEHGEAHGSDPVTRDTGLVWKRRRVTVAATLFWSDQFINWINCNVKNEF